MNAPVLLAQLSGSTQTSSPEPKTLKIEKPTNGQALSFHLDGNTRLDLSDIASEKLTFVKVGEKLIVLFDNQSTVTVDPVFDSATGDPLSDVGFQVGADRVLSGDQFAALFPISTDQSILPAAGNSGPTGGADFHDAQVGALGPGGTPLGLLGDENSGGQQFGTQDTGFAGITFGTATVGQLDDEGLTDGLIGGPGDEPGSATSVTGNLSIDFGSVGVSGASLAFSASQPTLFSLTSGGEPINLLISNPPGGTPTIIGFVGSDPNASGSHVFEISLNLSTSTGEYIFTLLRPLDHPGANTEDTLNLVIEYSVTNTSGTFTSAFGVHVNDDSPELDPNGFDHPLTTQGSEGSEGSEGGLLVSHDNVTDPTGDNLSIRGGTLGILWGADHFNAYENGGISETAGQTGDRSLVFTNATVELSSGEVSLTNNLFSHGEQVQFQLMSNGIRLVAFTSDGTIVFTVDLTDTGSGGYIFTQYQELDHVGTSGEQSPVNLDALDLAFHYTATDSDGDSVAGEFKVTVNDDTPTIDVEGIDNGQIAEDALDNGNQGDTYNNTQGTESLLFSGDLGVSWGADDSNSGSANRSLAFDGVSEGGTVKDHDGSPVTSHDLAVHYHLTTVGDQALLVGYTGNAAAEDQSNWVFTVQLDDNSNTGSYTFTLLKPIDHPTENSEDNLTLDFGFTATDADGDPASGSFSVTINDDAPAASDTIVARTLDEGDISTWWSAGSSSNDGASDGSDTGGPLASFLSGLFGITVGGPAYISGSVAATVAFGADGAHAGGGFGFATDAIATMEGLGLTSRGGAVHYTLIGDTLIGYVNNNANQGYQFWSDRPVLALTLHSDGSYEFRQFDQLDHVDNDSDPHNFALKTSSGSIDTIDFGALITATDGDGDSLSLAGKFTIAIQDDIPKVMIAANGTVTIDETGGHQNGNDDNTMSSSARHLFDSVAGYAGSDPDMTGPIYARDNMVSTTTTTGADDPAAKTLSLQIDAQDSGLTTTDGHHIYLYQVSDTLVVGRVDGENGVAAFAIAIEQSGKVSVAQYISLQHNDDSQSNESVDLTGKLSAVVTVTDYDGDTVTQTTDIGDNIKFLDDGPKLAGTVEARTVDEGDISTLWSAGSSPNDGASDGSDTGGPLASFLSGLFGFSVGGPAYISGSVAATVAFGADGAHAGGGFGFAADATATMEGIGLTSRDGTVHYVMVGDTLVGYVEQPGFDRPVMTLTLHSDGSYEFRQFDQLDHVSGGEHNLALQTTGGSIDAIDFGALITATDGDGDTVSLEGKFTIAIQDDTPIQIAGKVVSGTVEEEQLPGGNEDKGPDPQDGDTSFFGFFIDNTTNVDTGNLRSLVSAGADEVTGTRGTFFLGDTSGLPSITSQGKPVSYVVTDGSDSGSLGDKLTAYVDLDGDHQFSTGDRIVFTLTLENNGTTSGNYVFTLLSPIDHTGSSEDTRTLDLSSVVRFSDYDGDTITLTNGSFKIDVIDDIPTIASNAAVVIDDDDVGTDGNPAGTGDQNPAHATGTLAHSYGADGAGTVKLLEGGAPGGFDYHVDSTGTILTISQTVGSVTTDVIQITLSDDTSGNYTVEQLAPIHHVSGGNENNQPFTVSYQVTDKDGDTAATNGTLSITVNDDTPAPVVVVNTVSENGTATLIEDETAGVQSGGPDADAPSDVKPEQDVDHLPSIFTGLTVLATAGAGIGFAERTGAVTLTPHYGADGPGEHHLHLTGAGGGTLNGVATNIFDTATGHRVFLYTDSTSGIVVGRLGSDDQANHPNPDGDIVFAIGLSDDGTLSLAQYRAIQHPNSGDRDEAVTLHTSGSTNDAIFVTATVTDSDNDSITTSPQALVIRFDDDAPIIDVPAAGANLIVNGQFTDNGGFGAPMSWGGQAAPADSNIAGWHIAGNDLERNPANWYVQDPANGGRVVDLDATPGNVTLSQTFGNLTDGESYTLTFDAAKPNGYDAKTEIYWNGQLVDTITPNGDHYEQFSLTLTAGDGTNTLEFREVGAADNGGTFLANVTMHATNAVVNEDALGGNAGGQGDAGTDVGSSATGGLGIHWGTDSSDVTDAGGVQDGATANAVSDNTAALTGRAVYFTDSDSASGGLQPAISAFAGSTAIALHADGQTILYQVLDNGTKLVGYTGAFNAADTANWVFTVSLSDEDAGKYNFNLLKPIDHPMTGSEDDINLVFGFTARDADGDTVNSTLTITVDDDTPVATNVTAVMFENDTVTVDLAGHYSYGADGANGLALGTAYISGLPSGVVLGQPSIALNPDGHTVTVQPGWALDGLSEGQQATLHIPFTVTDGDGDTVIREILVTVTGTNDGLGTSEGTPDGGTMTEYAESDPRAGSSDDRTVFDSPPGYGGYNGGTFHLYDPDQSDTHTIQSIQALGSDYLGSVTASVTQETIGDGAGVVSWQYHVTDAELNPLGAGEHKTETFRITIQDDHGQTTYRDITVELVGSNDSPIITVGSGDSAYRMLNETNAGLTAVGTLTVTDVDTIDTVHATVLSVSAGGSNIEHYYDNATLLSMLSVAPDPVLDSNGARTGALTWTFDSNGEAFNFLPNGWESTLNYTIQVSDGHGGFDTQVVQIKLHGTNDAPVITSGALGSVTEAGDLPQVDEAGLGGGLTMAAALLTPGVASALGTLESHPENLETVLTTVQTEQGGNLATAIVTVWQHLNDAYVTAAPTDVPAINEAFTWLGVEYAAYLKSGGMPLVDIIGKYTADGIDSGNLPDRLQSLHDNLLGNLGAAALTQRYGSGALHDQLEALITGIDPDLLDRPYASGNEASHDVAGAHAWDAAHGYATYASGTLTATDADAGHSLTWSAGTLDGTYGTFTVDIAGHWTYVLDNDRPVTDALAQGTTGTETFSVTVTDDQNASTTTQVTITINGTNDAPEITSSVLTVPTSEQLHNVQQADATHTFEPAANLDSQIASALGIPSGSSPDTAADMKTIVTNVQANLGGGATFADAIAQVWDYLDDNYQYYNTPVNHAGVLLGLVYAEYLLNGGQPLLDTIAKFNADTNNDGFADRSQSLHDNLLGNLDLASIDDKFSSNPPLRDYLLHQLEDAGLAGRPIYGGYQADDPAAAHAWDQTHGLLPVASGQLTATDVDDNHTLTWSVVSGTSPYGTMMVDQTGAWHFTAADNAATQALAAGEPSAPQTFVIQVTDEHGAFDTIPVTIVVTGTNDAPVITQAHEAIVNAGFEADTSYNQSGPEGQYTNGSPSGWSVTGPSYGGWFDPTPNGAGGSNNVLTMPDENGNNVLWLNDGQVASQVVGTASAGRYELSVEVGDRTDSNLHGMPDFAVRLYAGSTLIAEQIVEHTTSDSYNWTLVKIAGLVDGSLSGQPLRIELANLEEVGSGGDFPQQVQVNFDNVTLDYVPTQTLTSITEDDVNNNGQSVASILGASIADSDHNAQQGIAITHTDSSVGTWQYSVDGGNSWIDMGNHSTQAALLLSATDLVRFVPDGIHGTTASFDYVAWDQTSGTVHDNADVINRGGTTAFSEDVGHAVINVTDVNDAPTATVDSTNLTETSATDAGVVPVNGTGNVLTNDHDVDGDSLSVILVRAANALPGAQEPPQYLTTGEATAHGTYGNLVMHSDGSYTYTPNAAYDQLMEGQQVTDVFKFGVSDGHGSDVPSYLTINITGANDGPVIDSYVGADSVSVSMFENTTSVAAVHATDVDGPTLTYTISGGADKDLFQIDGSTGALSFIHAPDFEQPHDAGADNHYNVTVTASDGTLYDTQSFDIQVTNVAESHPPITVTNDGAYYAFSDNDHAPARQPVTINFDADNIFGGGSDTFSYTFTQVYSSTGTNWLTVDPTHGTITGDPEHLSALTVYRIDAVDTVTHQASFTYVAFSALPDGSDYASLTNSSSGGGATGGNVFEVAPGATPSGNISGGSGGDVLIGNNEENTFNSSSGTDAIYGMGGNDTLSGNGSSTSFLSGGAGDDTLNGGNVHSYLLGGAGNDTLNGGKEADVLMGGDGGDTIYGGRGDDWIVGGAGQDTLKGEDGHDTFIFAESGTSNYDTILDYNGSEDKLDLSALLDANFVNGTSNQSDFVKLVNSGNDVKVQVDADGTGTGVGWTDVAVLQGYHQSGNHVLVEFESQVRTMTVTA